MINRWWHIRCIILYKLLLPMLTVAGAVGIAGCKSSQWGAEPTDEPEWPEYASLVNDSTETTLPYSGETAGYQPGELQTPELQPPASPQVNPVGYVTSGSTSVLKVHGVQPQGGPVRVAIFSEPTAFPDPQQASAMLALPSQSSSVESPLSVDPGQAYAVAAFQDLNNDGVLNRSSFGMPSEPYGFSRNAMGKFGPPSFEAAAIKPGDASAVEINLR